MPKLSRKDVLKLAELAKLELSREEVDKFALEISHILAYVEKLQAVKVDGLDPTYQVTGLKNVMRADRINDFGLKPSELLKNAPGVERGYIKVRRIL